MEQYQEMKEFLNKLTYEQCAKVSNLINPNEPKLHIMGELDIVCQSMSHFAFLCNLDIDFNLKHEYFYIDNKGIIKSIKVDSPSSIISVPKLLEWCGNLAIRTCLNNLIHDTSK